MALLFTTLLGCFVRRGECLYGCAGSGLSRLRRQELRLRPCGKLLVVCQLLDQYGTVCFAPLLDGLVGGKIPGLLLLELVQHL